MTNWHMGMKIVCVRSIAAPELQNGSVYTISNFESGSDGIGLLLCEVQPGPGYYAYNPNRFRPVVSRPTSIAVFTAMLSPSRVDA